MRYFAPALILAFALAGCASPDETLEQFGELQAWKRLVEADADARERAAEAAAAEAAAAEAVVDVLEMFVAEKIALAEALEADVEVGRAARKQVSEVWEEASWMQERAAEVQERIPWRDRIPTAWEWPADAQGQAAGLWERAVELRELAAAARKMTAEYLEMAFSAEVYASLMEDTLKQQMDRKMAWERVAEARERVADANERVADARERAAEAFERFAVAAEAVGSAP